MKLLCPSACLALVLAVTSHAQAGIVLDEIQFNHNFSSEALPIRAFAYDSFSGNLLTGNLHPDPSDSGDGVNRGLPGTVRVLERQFDGTIVAELFSFDNTDLSAEVLKVLPNGNLLMLQGDATLVEVDRTGSVVAGGFEAALQFDPLTDPVAVLDVAIDHTTGDIYATTGGPRGGVLDTSISVRRFSADGSQLNIWRYDDPQGLIPDDFEPVWGIAFDSGHGRLLASTEGGAVWITPDGVITSRVVQYRDAEDILRFFNGAEMDFDPVTRQMYYLREETLSQLAVIPEPASVVGLIVVGAILRSSRNRRHRTG